MYRRKKDLLRFVRSGQPMTVRQQVYLAAQLSIPSIFAQISSVIMQYIDASMVGSLGANASASIGLVSTTTWLFMGLCTSVDLPCRWRIFSVPETTRELVWYCVRRLFYPCFSVFCWPPQVAVSADIYPVGSVEMKRFGTMRQDIL